MINEVDFKLQTKLTLDKTTEFKTVPTYTNSNTKKSNGSRNNEIRTMHNMHIFGSTFNIYAYLSVYTSEHNIGEPATQEQWL